jgi:hypothetical protein
MMRKMDCRDNVLTVPQITKAQSGLRDIEKLKFRHQSNVSVEQTL